MEFRRAYLLSLFLSAVGIIVFIAILLVFALADQNEPTAMEQTSTAIASTNIYLSVTMDTSATITFLQTVDAVGTQATQQTATVNTTPTPNPTPPAP